MSNNKLSLFSRCREWERARRNKFNEAISKLGEIVKSIQKSNNPAEDSEDVQYPKIEIIQKAIIYLNNFVQEKTLLSKLINSDKYDFCSKYIQW